MILKILDGLQNLTTVKVSWLLLKITISWGVKNGLFKMILK